MSHVHTAARLPVKRPSLWSVLSGSNWDKVVHEPPPKPLRRKSSSRRKSSASVSSNQSLSSPLHSAGTYPLSAFQGTCTTPPETPTKVATLRQRKLTSELTPDDIEASDVTADVPLTPSPSHSLTQHTLTRLHELHDRGMIPDTIPEEESDDSVSDEEEVFTTYQHDKLPFPVS